MHQLQILHRYCLNSELLIWISSLSDAGIFLSYFLIFLMAGWIFWRRRDLTFKHPKLYCLYASFILVCGITHFMAVWVLIYRPDYVVEMAIKAAASLLSLSAATSTILAFRHILALPPFITKLAAQMQEIQDLRSEIHTLQSALDISNQRADLLINEHTRTRSWVSQERQTSIQRLNEIMADVHTVTTTMKAKYQILNERLGLDDAAKTSEPEPETGTTA